MARRYTLPTDQCCHLKLLLFSFPEYPPFFYLEIISSIIRYSIWVDVKGRLPVKITGNQIKQGILKPVEIDSFILGGTIRLLREFERNMMAHRANIAARHYIPPEWTVSVPAFSCFVFP